MARTRKTTLPTIPTGTRVRVIDIHQMDAYHNNIRPGTEGTVDVHEDMFKYAPSGLHQAEEEGWYRGAIRLDPDVLAELRGEKPHGCWFYAVQVEVIDAPEKPGDVC